jgi:outer membrane protein
VTSRRLTIALVTLLFAASAAWSQKIGYVSTETIRKNFDAAVKAEQRLEGLIDGWKKELDQMRRDIEDLELEMKKNRLIWSDQERDQKQRELDLKKKGRDDFARQKFEPGGEHDKVAQELYEGVWEKIYLAVQKVASDEGYDMVWDKSTQPLVYVNAKFDITVKVMKVLGIDADELERKQAEVISADPRNLKAEEHRSRRSRRRSTSRPDPTPVPEPPAEEVPADTTQPRTEDIPR